MKLFRRFKFFKRSFDDESDLLNPKEWLIKILGGSNTYSGERITSQNAILNSNIYTCASILGGDIGKLPIQVFKRSKGSIERDTSHPVAQLLGIRPNPYMSAYTFKELMQVHTVLWGNGYASIEWGEDGYPKGLWPLNPALTDVVTDPRTMEVWYVTTLPSGEQRKLPWYDVIHFKSISTTGLKGITPISVVREKLGSQQATDKFLASFYANGTTSQGLLKTEQKLDKTAKDRMREEWQNLYSGLTNAHRIAILDAGLQYQSLGMPLKDAEFIETMKFGILEIAKIYKIPPHKLGQLDRATFSNIEHQSIEYVKNTLQPIITNWEQEINYKLFTELERRRYYVKFNVTSELRGDSQSRAQYYKEMIAAGIYSINEIRELEERDNIGPDGDKHFISHNLIPIEIVEDLQKSRIQKQMGLKGGDGNGEGDPSIDD